MKLALASLPVYALIWGLIFYWQPLEFWPMMLIGSGVVIAFSMGIGWREGVLGRWFAVDARRVGTGVVSGIALYLVFRLGFETLSHLDAEWTAAQVRSLYRLTENIDLAVMATLVVFVVIPGEELYWRGVIQHLGLGRYGAGPAIVGSSLLYGAVNAWGGNPLQVLAGVVCGLVWGTMAWRSRGLVAPLICHVVWDMAILVFFPLR